MISRPIFGVVASRSKIAVANGGQLDHRTFAAVGRLSFESIEVRPISDRHPVKKRPFSNINTKQR